MEINFKALGTDIHFLIVGVEDDFLEKSLREFYREKEKLFSRFLKDSQLSFLNSNLGKYNPASSEMTEVARKSLEYFKKTGGYFDPRIIGFLEDAGYEKSFKMGGFGFRKNAESGKEIKTNLEDDLKIRGSKIFFGCRMDFSGIAKGYITDRAAEFLRGLGYKNILVDSGGDIRVLGNDKNGENWKIALEDFPEEKLLLELDGKNQGVATSGITRRKWQNKKGKFHHLINPQKPEEFKFDLKSVTVVGKNCEEADVWAKVLFLLGKEDGLKICEEKNIRSLFLDYRGNVWLSKAMKKYKK